MITDVSTLLSVIQKNTFTVTDTNRRLGLLRQCIDHALFTESDEPLFQRCIENLKEEGDRADVKAMTQWGEPLFTAFNRGNVSSKMTEIQAVVDDLPLLTLYVPVSFDSEEITEIGKWCRSECDESILIDVHVEPSVVGGCAFVWNDVYHEFSFRSRVRERAGVITDILSGYAN